MSRDLTNLFIDETFQYLTQISGSNQDILLDGVGNRITELQVTASNATSASYAVTASYALNVPAFDTGSLLVTASAVDATLTFTKGDSSTFDVTVNNVTDAVYAQNTVITGKSLEASPILKGTPLYFTGSGTNGNLVGVYLADAGNPDRMPVGGVAAQDIDPGEEGIVLLDGYIGGVSTSAFQSGDKIYVGVGGGYTNVAPTGSNNKVQFLGNVEKSHPSNGSGVINMMGEARALPNIQEGYLWVGDANDVPQAISTSSIAGDSFPYTGSAGISGSLAVVGPISSETFGTISLTGDNPGINRNILDFTGADFSVIRSDSGMVIDNTAGTGSISVFTNGNMQYEPQGDLDFYTPTGRVNLTGNKVKITDNSTTPFDCTQINTRYFSVNLAETGSGFGGMRIGTNNQFLNMAVGGYDGGGNWITTTQMNFGGSQQAFFSADTDFYIKNNDGSNGQVVVWADGTTIVRAGTSVEIQGGNFPGEEVPINIKGDAFLYSATTNINGFTYQVDNQTTVRDNQRAFVETPLVITNLGSVSVGLNSVLKVINEL